MLRQGLARAGAALRLTTPAGPSAWAPAGSLHSIWDGHSYAKKAAPAGEPKGKKGGKKAGDAKPKRVKVAYAFFTEEKYNELRSPGEGLPEVTRKVAALWKTMSDKEKAPYQAKSDQDRARHTKEMAAWEKANPPKPKRKPVGYTLFVQEDMAKLRKLYPSMSAREMMATAAANWRILGADGQQEYKDAAAKL